MWGEKIRVGVRHLGEKRSPYSPLILPAGAGAGRGLQTGWLTVRCAAGQLSQMSEEEVVSGTSVEELHGVDGKPSSFRPLTRGEPVQRGCVFGHGSAGRYRVEAVGFFFESGCGVVLVISRVQVVVCCTTGSCTSCPTPRLSRLRS